MEKLTKCPGCGHTLLETYMKAKDWLVTQEEFTLARCTDCGLVFTNPRPAEDEIGRYYQSEEYISHSDTKKGAMALAYQTVRRFTLRSKLALVNGLVPEKGTLLDAGCGTGHFLEVCRNDGWKVQGTEPGPDARALARGKGLDVTESILELPAKGQYQIITMWHVLEHVHRLGETLAHLNQLLAAGGKLVIAVPNHFSADARNYKADWAAYDVPRHLYHFNPDSLRRTVQAHGFQFLRQRGMPADAFYVSLLSEKNRNGSPVSALVTGLTSNLKATGSGQYSSLTFVFEKRP